MKRVDDCKYLGSVITDSADIDRDMAKRMCVSWMNWRDVGVGLCDSSFLPKLKSSSVKEIQVEEIRTFRIASEVMRLD